MYCPLCFNDDVTEYRQVSDRLYFRCVDCSLIFLDPALRLNRVDEKAIYEYHQNDPDDPDYRQFVAALYEPLVERLQPGASGLEFGCGAGSALSAMFVDSGFKITEYDPFYYPDELYKQQCYDFITATEVFEHLYDPGEVLQQLQSLIKKRGTLGIMTSLYNDEQDFSAWHYIRDSTHVCFYSTDTFKWIANTYKASLEVTDSNVILLQF